MLNGKGHEGGEDDEERGPLPEPPPQIAELVAACVRFVSSRYRVQLDGTQDTLSLLDHYVRDARADIQVKPETLALVQGAVGAYLGEVMRHAFRGAWFAEGDVEGWRLDMTHVFLTFNPIGMAREALLLEPAENWHAHLDLEPEDKEELERRLAILGEVDEDEYYAPTTRYEVVEIAVDLLRGRMQERGLEDVTFGPDDYKRK